MRSAVCRTSTWSQADIQKHACIKNSASQSVHPPGLSASHKGSMTDWKSEIKNVSQQCCTAQ